MSESQSGDLFFLLLKKVDVAVQAAAKAASADNQLVPGETSGSTLGGPDLRVSSLP